jgi:hypothetical protein
MMIDSRYVGTWAVIDSGDDFQERFGLRLSCVTDELKRHQIILQIGEEYKTHQFGTDPVAYMPKEAVQNLMDSLWRNGFRPKGEGTIGQLEAKDSHITDLRNIILKLFDIMEKK